MIKDDMKEKILRERLVSKKTVSELVDEYGVSAGSISRWTRDYLASHDKDDISDLCMDKSNELTNLRKQNMEQLEEIQRLNHEKSILEGLLMKLYEHGSTHIYPSQGLSPIPTQTIKNESKGPTQVQYIHQYTSSQDEREFPPGAEAELQ